MIYFVPIFFCILFSICYDFNHRNQGRLICYIFLCTFLILIASLRYKVGGDTIRYMEEFKYYPTLFNLKATHFQTSGVMPLCLIFFSFCKTISSSFYFLQFVHAFFINFVIFLFFYKHTRFIFSSVLFYIIWSYLEFNTEIIRESMAVCFVLLGVDKLIKRRYIKYYFFCFIALGFHLSAILAFFMPLFYLFKWNFWGISICFGIIGLITIVYQILPSYFSVLNFLGSDAEVLLQRYYKEEAKTGNLTTLLIYSAKWIVLPVFSIMIVRRGRFKESFKFVGFIMIGMVLSSFIQYSYAFYRFINYLMPYFWMLLGTSVVSLPTLKSFRLLRKFSLLLLLSYLLYAFLSINFQYMVPGKEDYLKYFPYTSIFNEEKVYRPEW